MPRVLIRRTPLADFLAALTLLTRLPVWRLVQPPQEAYRHTVPYWPLTGWITGGLMAAVLWLAAQVLPLQLAWLVALAVRLLLTGCLHEDGLGDFFDGFGGGTSREATLRIMKDSHAGSYAVVGLAAYGLLLAHVPTGGLPLPVLCALLACGDPWCKAVAAQIINVLPYARPESDCKMGVTYRRMSRGEVAVSLVAGVLPVLCLPSAALLPALLAPVATFAWLVLLMHKRLGGYTGDCCGALFLLCELSFLLCAVALWRGLVA